MEEEGGGTSFPPVDFSCVILVSCRSVEKVGRKGRVVPVIMRRKSSVIDRVLFPLIAGVVRDKERSSLFFSPARFCLVKWSLVCASPNE